MKDFTDFLNKMEDVEIPAQVHQRFEATLSTLPGKGHGKPAWGKWVACFAILLGMGIGFLAANPAIAANIPLLRNLFREVETNALYTGDYDSVAYLFEQNENTVQADNGLTISASEGYCDGFSAFVTFELKAGEPLFSNMPQVITGQALDANGLEYVDIASDYLYLDYFWKLSHMADEQTGHAILYGAVVDDHTFIGMLKIDIGDALLGDLASDAELRLSLRRIGYDKLDAMYGDDIMCELISGEWMFILPIELDTKAAKLVLVDEKNDAGYGIEKVLISPYQVVVYAYVPHTLLTEEEIGTEADFIKNKLSPEQAAQDNVHLLYEAYRQELLERKQYEYVAITLFNGKEEHLQQEYSSDNVHVYPVQNMDTQQLHIYLATELGALARPADMQSAKDNSVFYTEIDGR